MSKHDLILRAGDGRMFLSLDEETDNLDIVYLKEEFAVEVGSKFGDIPNINEEMIERHIALCQVDAASKRHVMYQVTGLMERKISYIVFPHGVIITFQDNQQSINTIVEYIIKWAAVGLDIDVPAW